jgi:THUMP domain-like
LGRFLFDPDPALVRAGLIDLFAARSGLCRLDDEEEYLTADQPVDSPFARPFEVLASLSNNDREIRGYFRGSAVGQLEIKCRRIPVDAEAVRRKLPLSRARALVCRRMPAPSAPPNEGAHERPTHAG